MIEERSAKEVFKELSDQNQAVNAALTRLHIKAMLSTAKPEIEQRVRSRLEKEIASSPVESETSEKYYHRIALPPDHLPAGMPRPAARAYHKKNSWPVFAAGGLVLIGVMGLWLGVGTKALGFFQQYWKTFLLPIGGICIGAGIMLAASKIGKDPLAKIAPPSDDVKNPLEELQGLAQRTVSRLNRAYALQLWTVIVVGMLLSAIIIWAMILITKGKMLYASAFGSGGMAMMILSKWKWQPFDRINKARKLANDADTLATGLRIRIQAIDAICDPVERAKEQWEAVKEYLDLTD